jgi:hypothetical protein
MQDSNTEERARRIIAWQQGKPVWTGNYDYFQSGGRFEGELTPVQLFSPLGLPPILTAEETVEHVFRSPLLLERLCEADWLSPLAEYDDEAYFPLEAVYMALGRLVKGEKPPRASSESEPVPGHPEIGKVGSLQGLVGAAKAAEFLDISPSTLRDYSVRGIIPCFKIGKHRKYDLVKVREKLEKEQRDSGLGRIESLKDLLR